MDHRQPKLTVCVNGRIARFTHIRLCMGTPRSGDLYYKTLYGNPLDFSKIFDIVMNDEIKLAYLLFSVYLFFFFVYFEAIWSHFERFIVG